MSHLMAGVLLSRDPAQLENTLRDIRLPFQPQVLSAVLRLRDDTRMDFIELDRLIRADQNIASIILKMANSTFYSRGQEIRTLPQAIGMIGFRTIVSIVAAASAKSIFMSGNYARFRRYVWQHSLVTSIIAKIICEQMHWKNLSEEVFIGGLLHDIGKVILNHLDREKYIAVFNKTFETGKPFRFAENELFGIDNAIVGQMVIKLWNLPNVYREVAVFTHRPTDETLSKLPEKDQQIIRIVGLANQIAKINDFGYLETDSALAAADYFASLGILPGSPLETLNWKEAIERDPYYQVFAFIG
ncbi:MAG: HDOD domain-containing protein [Leptospiraceae bacterium]|nr:HDOD domain-containing protein [Leptospiraceae bacterium]